MLTDFLQQLLFSTEQSLTTDLLGKLIQKPVVIRQHLPLQLQHQSTDQTHNDTAENPTITPASSHFLPTPVGLGLMMSIT